MFNKYFEESVHIRNKLELWHENQVRALHIDLNNNRISKSGFKGVVSAIPGLLDDNWNYKELEKGLAEKISTQVTGKLKIPDESVEVYDNDVDIVIKNDKYYYLLKDVV